MENMNGNSNFRGNPQFLYPGLPFSNNNGSETNQNVPEQYQCANSESNIIDEYPSWIDELLDDSENPKESYHMNTRNYNGVQSCAINEAPMNIGMHQSHSSSYGNEFMKCTQDASDDYYYMNGRDYKGVQNCAINEVPTNIGMHQSHSSPRGNEFMKCTQYTSDDDYYMNGKNYKGVQSCAINEALTNIGMHHNHSSPYGNEFMKCTQDTSGDYYYINGRDYKGVQNCAINEVPTNIGMHQSHSSPRGNEFMKCTQYTSDDDYYMNGKNYKGEQNCAIKAPMNIGMHQSHSSSHGNEFTGTKDAHANYHYMNARNYKGKEICVNEAPTNIGIHQIHPSQDGVKVSSHGRFSLGSTSRSNAAIPTYIERQEEDFTPLNGCSDQTRVKPQFAQRSRVHNLIYIDALKRNIKALQIQGDEDYLKKKFLKEQNFLFSLENKLLLNELENVADKQLLRR
ncbi:hypothetical protein ZOSMA_22G00770 [Zostera marina]|uniref:Uncharacterized protein n=1 Tax=Zostera marina TaxID=29655 RepID=A0A0K9PKM0_ZOSMR|nr:hypothetical protein ZOSMA_22G00770 [Zostera marina]